MLSVKCRQAGRHLLPTGDYRTADLPSDRWGDVFVDVGFWLLVHDELLGLMVCWLETPNSSGPLAVQPTVAKVCAAKFSAKGVLLREAELSLFATNGHYPRSDTRRSGDARW